eukprot:gene25881-biopygen17864
MSRGGCSRPKSSW